MNPLEYRALKQKSLIKLDGTTATIDRGEITVIDPNALKAEILRRQDELDILTELLNDLT